MTDPGLVQKLQKVQGKLNEIIQRAEWLLDSKSSEAQGAAEGARAFVKLFFDVGQGMRSQDNKLQELVVQGFDREQIWEELEVQNVPLRQSLRKHIPKLLAAPKGAIDLSMQVVVEKSDEELEPLSMKVATDEGQGDGGAEESKTTAPPAVNDEEDAPEELQNTQDFFDLDEMEKFADLTDGARWRLDDDAAESDFDLLEAGDDDEEAGNITFKDFFGDQPGGGENDKDLDDDDLGDVDDDEDDEDEKEAAELDDLEEEERALEEQLQALGVEDEEEEEEDHINEAEVEEGEKTPNKDEVPKTSSLYDMDRRLKSLEEEVQKLEEEQLQEKSWEMKGEVFAKQRPLNSLLEVALDQPMTHFAARRAEDIAGDADAEDEALEDAPGADMLTKKAKFDLEAIIKQRVWDEAFDDVVRKTQLPPSQRPQSEEDAVETLNFEKSRVGLGDIYAKQYEAEMLGHQTDDAKAEDKAKTELKELFARIMFKLDQLSNAHFTPRPPMVGAAADAAAKVPSLKMEETIPLMVSDASLQAPEEAKAPRRHEKDQEELSPDEKTAVRRSRKVARKKGLERKVEGGEMSLKDRREREEKLQEKNQKAKVEKASVGKVKDTKKRLKASELLAQAAENAKSDMSKKEEVRKQREARPENTPSCKRLKL